MRIFMINSVCGNGSTGRIVTDLCAILKNKGCQVRVAYGIGESSRIEANDTVRIGNKISYYTHNLASRFTDRAGFYSFFATLKLIKEIVAFKPDLIHLHNLHGSYINIKVLFEYLSKADIPVIWTLHDCWAMTGHCAHFAYNGCMKWKTGCHHCPQKNAYPKSYVMDQSRRNYKDKKRLFTSVPNLTICTPSKWLADIVKQSFLGDFPVHVMPNGIDLEVFKPTPSNFREAHDIGNRKMILAVSNVWIKKKGFLDICKLADIINQQEYVLVVVGVTEEQKRKLPVSVIAIARTQNAQQMAEIYTAADVFINPSYEETFGMVTAEAMACGTPCVVYDQTAVPEPVDLQSGDIVPAGDIDTLYRTIQAGREVKVSCVIGRAAVFEKKNQYIKYLHCYHDVVKKKIDKG